MGTGRYIYFYEPTANGKYTAEQLKTHKRSFKPPKKVMQSSAIGLIIFYLLYFLIIDLPKASCYSRFKSTTKYLGQIDVDEYLMIDKRDKKNSYRNMDFKSFVDRVFNKYTNAPAIAFRPVFMDDCRDKPLQSRFNNYQTFNSSSGIVTYSVREDYKADNTYKDQFPYEEGEFILPRYDKMTKICCPAY
jgi:hypothetical protein